MRKTATGTPRRNWIVLPITLCIAAQGMGPGSIEAQGRPSIDSGDRIRITAPSLGLSETVCDVARVDETEALANCDGADILTAIPWNSVERLDVSEGRKGRALVGGLVGLGAGAALGAILASATTSEDDWLFSTDDVMGPAILGFGLAGGLVGAIIGNSIKRDVWTPAPRWVPAVSVEGGPGPGGWGLGVRMTF